MTTPNDPFAPPPEGGSPPLFAQSAAPQPGYGQPQYGTPYGAPSPFGQPGGPQLASWGPRVGAYIVDTLITLAINYLPLLLGVVSGSGALTGVLGLLGALGGIAFTAWNLVRQGRTGQTVGKGVVGISLRREQDGQVVGAGLSIGRAFVHVVDAIPFGLGYLWPIWDAKKQTFADKILSTVVIQA